MPRLPTMRVIGSQFISTRFPFLPGASLVGAVIVLISIAPLDSLVASGVVSRGQFRAGMAPFRFFVDGRLGHAAQGANGAAIGADRGARYLCARRLIHEGHEFVGEAGHGTAYADAADVGAAADSGHPSALRDVAIHHRAPAPQFHNAFRGAVHFGEVALFVITRTIATFV